MTSTNGRLEIFKTDARGRIRVPVERREALLEEFARSGLSAAAFAQIDGVRVAHLERRADAERHRLQRALVQRVRHGRRVDQATVLDRRDLAGAHAQRVATTCRHSFTITCLISV